MNVEIGKILQQMGETLSKSDIPQFVEGGKKLFFVGMKIVSAGSAAGADADADGEVDGPSASVDESYRLTKEDLQFIHDFIQNLNEETVAPALRPVVSRLKSLYRAEMTQ